MPPNAQGTFIFSCKESIWLAHYYVSPRTFTRIHIKLCWLIFLLCQSYLNPCSRMLKQFYHVFVSYTFFFPLRSKRSLLRSSHTSEPHTNLPWSLKCLIKNSILFIGHISILKRPFQVKMQTGTHFWSDFCLLQDKPKKKKFAFKVIFQIYL